jgi:glycerol-3-phosphate cytidylyltransferase
MTTGFTCGTWDLVHAGHVEFLDCCRAYCDELIVGLQTDPSIDRPEKNKPVQTIYERYSQLSGLAAVNYIYPYDNEADLINLMATIEVDYRFLDSHYEKKARWTGKILNEEMGVKIIFIPRKHNWSSTELRIRIKNAGI